MSLELDDGGHGTLSRRCRDSALILTVSPAARPWRLW
jgi:hypothetical protein